MGGSTLGREDAVSMATARNTDAMIKRGEELRKSFGQTTNTRLGSLVLPDDTVPAGSSQPGVATSAPRVPVGMSWSDQQVQALRHRVFKSWLDSIKQERLTKLKDWVYKAVPVKAGVKSGFKAGEYLGKQIPAADACQRCHKECAGADGFLDTAWCDSMAFPEKLVSQLKGCKCVGYEGHLKSATRPAVSRVITPKDLGIDVA